MLGSVLSRHYTQLHPATKLHSADTEVGMAGALTVVSFGGHVADLSYNRRVVPSADAITCICVLR